MHYIFQLQACVNRYQRGEINATITLEKCRKILNDIKDPEFPFFAARHYRELFSFIIYQLPKDSLNEEVEIGKHRGLLNRNVTNRACMKGREKRKYQRVKLPLPVMFRLKKKLFPSFWKMATTEDLGSMGMLFQYKNVLRIGSLIDLKIGSSQTTRTINCIGEIIRTSKSPNASRSGIAIQFVYIGENERRVLNQLLSKNEV
ncbi:MAG: hypothetical protein SCALA701_00010 [Candidatus Scalindua sp.]|nr:MAG: hypothetical protein SCALA701_00010 [Candidatus Scalindua sp.]